MENKKRSLLKALSWRVIGFISTTFIALALTKEASLAIMVGITDTIIKFYLYYVHERFWNSVKWGVEKEQIAG